MDTDLESFQFVCQACGTDVLQIDGGDIVPLNHLPKEFLGHPFSGLTDKVIKQIAQTLPAYAKKVSWLDYTLLDATIIAKSLPPISWDIPFEQLNDAEWNCIWPYCQEEVFFAKRFISSSCIDWLEKARQEGKLTNDGIIRIAITLTKRSGGFSTNGTSQFISFICNGVNTNAEWSESIAKFPAVLHREIYVIRPDCPGLMSEKDIISTLAPKTAIKWLERTTVQDTVLRLYPFEKFHPEHWRKALKIIKRDVYGRFTTVLKEAWPSLGLGVDEIYALLSENPACIFVLPVDDFSVETFLFLIPHIKIDGYDLVVHCHFDKFSNKDWVDLLSNSQTAFSPSLEVAVRECCRLTPHEKSKVLKTNPNATRCFSLSEIPVDDAIEFCIFNPGFDVDYDFLLACTKEQATRFLTKAHNIPACVCDILAKDSYQNFSIDEISGLLTCTPDLAMYMPEERIADLDVDTFCLLARRFNGAGFWTSNYNLNALPKDKLIPFVKEFPWLADSIDLDGLDFDVLDDVFDKIPSLWKKFNHRGRYLVSRFRMPIVLTIFLITAILVWGAWCFTLTLKTKEVVARTRERRTVL